MSNNYDRFLKPIDKALLKPHRQWLTSWAYGKTLEIAVGTGLNLKYYPNSVSLTAIDHNQDMMKFAIEKAKELHMDVNFIHSSAETLPFEDNSFDTVIMTYLLCGVKDVDTTLMEALRVLKPNGNFLMANHIQSNYRPLAFLQKGLDKLTVAKHNEHWTRTPLENLKTKATIVQIKTDTFNILESVYALKNTQ